MTHQNLSLAALLHVEPSGLRWFTPLPVFWDELKNRFPGIVFIDVGTGCGDLPREAKEQSVTMVGIDIIVSRETPFVRRGYGEHWAYSPTIWPIICRPCHSGFPRWVLAQARSFGASMIYVGFNKNRVRDVGYIKPQIVVSKIGVENESMYLFE